MIHLVSLPFLAIATVAVLSFALVITWRRRDGAGALWFLAALTCAMWWLGGFGVNMFVTDLSMSKWINTLTLIGAVLVPLAVLGFTLAYTGRHRWLSTPVFSALVVIPASSVGILLAEQSYGFGLYRVDVELLTVGQYVFVSFDYGPWGNLQLAYSYMLLAISIALLTELTFDERPLYRSQGMVLVSAIFAPLLINTLVIADIGIFGVIDVTPIAFILTGGLVLLGLHRYHLLESVPVPTRVAHHATLESLDSPVIVIDSADEIIHMNPSAERLVSEGDNPLIGASADSLPGIRSSEGLGPRTESAVEVQNGNGRRIYSIRSTPLEDEQDNRYGTILLYQDITDHRLREQRLNVLNRVLRHDIRTEMNVILGHARRSREAPEEVQPSLQAIEETARSIVSTSETARNIERLVEIAPRLEPSGALKQVIDDLEARLARNHPAIKFTTTVTVPGSSIVPLGFEPVIWQLLDNAARHNTRSEGSIHLQVTPADKGWIRVAVCDNGPGIPPDELSVFERGETSPLEHASGLGLWLVHWVVTEFGGDVTVSSTDEGTDITLMMPIIDHLEPTE